MKDSFNGTLLVAVFVTASLLFMGVGSLAASQDREVTDTARAPPTGYYTITGADGIPVHTTQIDTTSQAPPVKEITTSQGGLSGFASGVSHV